MSDSTSEESAEQIGEWLAVLVEPDSTVEMRVLSQAGKMRVQHYQSDDLSRMALDALQLGRGAKGVYWLMNRLGGRHSQRRRHCPASLAAGRL